MPLRDSVTKVSHEIAACLNDCVPSRNLDHHVSYFDWLYLWLLSCCSDNEIIC